jgi:hypothetical protein
MVHVGVKALYDGKSVRDAGRVVRETWAQSTAPQVMVGTLGGDGVWGCALCGVGWSGKRDLHGHPALPTILYPSTICPDGIVYQLPVLDEKKSHLRPKQACDLVEQYATTYLGAQSVRGGMPFVGSKQPYECIWNEGYAESETECALPDRAVRDGQGKLWAMDLKTTGAYITSAWERSFEHNQQVAMQLDVLEHTLGERVEGFILDAVNVRPASDSSKSFVRYGPLTYSDVLRAELREHRKRLKVRADQLAELPGAALKAPGACVRYNELCSYFDLCHADPADREPLVQIALTRGKMEIRAWEPKHRDDAAQ